MSNHWSENGDMIIAKGTPEETRFRPVGWMINGGPNDGLMIKEMTDALKKVAHGSFTPLLIEIGD